MKTRTFFLTILAILVAGICKLEAQKASVIEKRIGNTVYELDTVGYRVKNKANVITFQEYGDCRVSFDDGVLAGKTWLEHFKPLFSKERAEELKVRIRISCVFDSTGFIKEVEMFFLNRENFEKFTLKEIKDIEDAAKKYQYKNLFWYECEGLKYARFYHPFSPYLLYFEKLNRAM